MARIHDLMLNLSFFLYKSEEDAETGSRMGGTAFCTLVALDHPREDYGIEFVVTARHLVDRGYTFARINHKDGGFRVIEITGWHHAKPDSQGLTADISVAVFRSTLALDHVVLVSGLGVSREEFAQLDIGIGCETYMIGRLVGFEGREENSGCVRFGNVSMVPKDPVFNKELGCDSETILVEMRSIGGHSGSPVFVNGGTKQERQRRVLGVVWGHLGDGVWENAGIAAVTPFWRIHDLLLTDERISAECQAIAETIPATDPPLVSPDGSWVRWNNWDSAE